MVTRVDLSGECDPLARVAVDEIEGGAPVADAWQIESQASATYAAAGALDAAHMARVAGCTVVFERRLPTGVDGLLLPRGTILVRPRRDARRTELVVLHELAHWLLNRERVAHSHADVWCLTLALGAPLPVLRRLRATTTVTPAELARVAAVPTWALRVRLAMPTAARAA